MTEGGGGGGGWSDNGIKTSGILRCNICHVRISPWFRSPLSKYDPKRADISTRKLKCPRYISSPFRLTNSPSYDKKITQSILH